MITIFGFSFYSVDTLKRYTEKIVILTEMISNSPRRRMEFLEKRAENAGLKVWDNRRWQKPVRFGLIWQGVCMVCVGYVLIAGVTLEKKNNEIKYALRSDYKNRYPRYTLSSIGFMRSRRKNTSFF